MRTIILGAVTYSKEIINYENKYTYACTKQFDKLIKLISRNKEMKEYRHHYESYIDMILIKDVSQVYRANTNIQVQELTEQDLYNETNTGAIMCKYIEYDLNEEAVKFTDLFIQI